MLLCFGKRAFGRATAGVSPPNKKTGGPRQHTGGPPWDGRVADGTVVFSNLHLFAQKQPGSQTGATPKVRDGGFEGHPPPLRFWFFFSIRGVERDPDRSAALCEDGCGGVARIIDVGTIRVSSIRTVTRDETPGPRFLPGVACHRRWSTLRARGC